MKRIELRIKLAASQPVWMLVSLTEDEYRNLFLTGEYQYWTVALAWPMNSTIMYDFEARQWFVADTKQALNTRYIVAAKQMTAKDRFLVRRLVMQCIRADVGLKDSGE